MFQQNWMANKEFHTHSKIKVIVRCMYRYNGNKIRKINSLEMYIRTRWNCFLWYQKRTIQLHSKKKHQAKKSHF